MASKGWVIEMEIASVAALGHAMNMLLAEETELGSVNDPAAIGR